MFRFRSTLTALLGALTLLAACTAPPYAEFSRRTDAPYVIHYQHNLELHLDDGRTLSADLYTPADPETGKPAAGPFPVIVGYTPYGKTSAAASLGEGGEGLNLELVRHGYLALVVDVPGTGASEGRFDLFDEAEAVAGAAIVRWAAELPRSNGKVGMIGHSYSAIDQLFTAAAVGPDSPLKAIIPSAATIDPYRDLFVSGGALNVISPLGLLFSYGGTRSTTPFTEADTLDEAVRLASANADQLSRFEAVMARDMLNNGERRYDGPWWQQRAPRSVLQRIVDNDVAVFLLGGLYDVFQRGEPLLYSGLQNAAAGRAVSAPMLADQEADPRFQLLTGPWHHGNIGEGFDLTALQLRWFDHWLKGVDNGVTDTREPLQVVEPDGSRWSSATYPVAGTTTRRLWLSEDGSLDAEEPSSPPASDRIQFSGFSGGCSESIVQFTAGLAADLCPAPRWKPTRTATEVTYSTSTLSEPLSLAGPITLHLKATSTRPDALFSVTLEDVAPDGRSLDISGGAQLGSMRRLDETSTWYGPDGAVLHPEYQLTRQAREPIRVGEPFVFEIEVRPAFATIPAGHRLRLRVATSDFPHIVPLADLPDLFGGAYDILRGPGLSSIDLSVRRGAG